MARAAAVARGCRPPAACASPTRRSAQASSRDRRGAPPRFAAPARQTPTLRGRGPPASQRRRRTRRMRALAAAAPELAIAAAQVGTRQVRQSRGRAWWCHARRRHGGGEEGSGRVEWQVWPHEAHRQEPRLWLRSQPPQCANRRGGDMRVGRAAALRVVRWAALIRRHDRVEWHRAVARPLRPHVDGEPVLIIPPAAPPAASAHPRRAATPSVAVVAVGEFSLRAPRQRVVEVLVEDLAVAHADVARLSEALRQRHHAGHLVAQVGDQVHDAVPVGTHARKERRARWRAVRDAGVRTREERAACCEGVDVRRVRSAVAVSSEVGPQVVDDEQEDVWTECGGGGVVGSCCSGEGRCGHAGRDATRPRGAPCEEPGHDTQSGAARGLSLFCVFVCSLDRRACRIRFFENNRGQIRRSRSNGVLGYSSSCRKPSMREALELRSTC
eukprot:scaffold26465_cov59-Phaeocystis_antarctica.AAC.2